MRAIVTEEQRRSREEACLPSSDLSVSPWRDAKIRKGRALLRGDLRRSSVTYSRYAPSSLLVAAQNRPVLCQGMLETLH